MRALLDVNVLIALMDAGHIHHEMAINWLEKNLSFGWASCPITQNGCIRIMSQPNYPGALPVAQVANRLAEAVGSIEHEFWPDSISLLDPSIFGWTRVLGHRQVTDIYLLALAVQNGGRFVTLDRRIGIDSVKGASLAQLVYLQA
jgi:toxin-antitoxin system PIN domain toxin